jgi:hypothetical protein
MLWVRISIRFITDPGPSTNKTDRHDITEIYGINTYVNVKNIRLHNTNPTKNNVPFLSFFHMR